MLRSRGALGAGFASLSLLALACSPPVVLPGDSAPHLEIVIAGSGSGAVASYPDGIVCPDPLCLLTAQQPMSVTANWIAL